MGTRGRVQLLGQLALGRIEVVFCLWLYLCVMGLGKVRYTTDFDMPLSSIFSLKACTTPTPLIFPRFGFDQSCSRRYTISELTGGQWSSLVSGGSVEVSCRRSSQSLVFIVRNYPSIKKNPLKALVAGFRAVAGKDMTSTAVDTLPIQCECRDDRWRGALAYAEETDSHNQVVAVHVKTIEEDLRRVLHHRTTCELPPFDIIHPEPDRYKASELYQFKQLRKCLWRLVLEGKTTPVVRTTRRRLFVYFVDERTFDPNTSSHNEQGTLVLEFPHECIMNRIDGEILVWVRQTNLSEDAAAGRIGLVGSENNQQQPVTELFVNVDPTEAGLTHLPYTRYELEFFRFFYYHR